MKTAIVIFIFLIFALFVLAFFVAEFIVKNSKRGPKDDLIYLEFLIRNRIDNAISDKTIQSYFDEYWNRKDIDQIKLSDLYFEFRKEHYLEVFKKAKKKA